MFWCLFYISLPFLVSWCLRLRFGLKLIGLTGGIASGKSAVTSFIRRRYGLFVVDFDQISREVVLPGTQAWNEIRQRFPSCFEQDNDELLVDRKALGALVFESSDDRARKDLNAIMKVPMLTLFALQLWRVFILRLQRQIVVDAPLLFEAKLHYLCDEIICVYCRAEIQLKRLCDRDGITREQAESRISKQMALSLKKRQSSVLFSNDGDLHKLYEQVEHFVHSSMGSVVLDEGMVDDFEFIPESYLKCMKPTRLSLLSGILFTIAVGTIHIVTMIWFGLCFLVTGSIVKLLPT